MKARSGKTPASLTLHRHNHCTSSEIESEDSLVSWQIHCDTNAPISAIPQMIPKTLTSFHSDTTSITNPQILTIIPAVKSGYWGRLITPINIPPINGAMKSMKKMNKTCNITKPPIYLTGYGD